MSVDAPNTVWTPMDLGPDFKLMWARNYPGVEPPQAFGCGPMRALLGREPVADDDVRWHISISCEDRVPYWAELVEAAHGLRPGVPFSIGIPPRSWWMNVHRYTLHLWETRDPHLVAEWRANAQGDRPS